MNRRISACDSREIDSRIDDEPPTSRLIGSDPDGAKNVAHCPFLILEYDNGREVLISTSFIDALARMAAVAIGMRIA
jgi:hypothetical protein